MHFFFFMSNVFPDNLSSNLLIIHASQEGEKRTNKPTIQIYDAFDLDNDMEVVETKSEFHYSRETSSKSLALTPDKKKEAISTNLSLVCSYFFCFVLVFFIILFLFLFLFNTFYHRFRLNDKRKFLKFHLDRKLYKR